MPVIAAPSYCKNHLLSATTALAYLAKKLTGRSHFASKVEYELVRPCKILVTGAPASGKGTVSKMLKETFDLHHVSSGDLLRSQIQLGSVLGKQASEFIEKGQFVPDTLVTDLVLASLSNINGCWLLDGFPRTLPQAEKLVNTFEINHVLNLDVPMEELIERTALRYIHPASGRTYHLKFNPPKTPGLDDLTQEPLIQRDDDKWEVVQKRLELYSAQTMPLLEFFDKKGLLLNFKGNNSHEIFAEIKQTLNKRLANQKKKGVC